MSLLEASKRLECYIDDHIAWRDYLSECSRLNEKPSMVQKYASSIESLDIWKTILAAYRKTNTYTPREYFHFLTKIYGGTFGYEYVLRPKEIPMTVLCIENANMTDINFLININVPRITGIDIISCKNLNRFLPVKSLKTPLRQIRYIDCNSKVNGCYRNFDYEKGIHYGF